MTYYLMNYFSYVSVTYVAKVKVDYFRKGCLQATLFSYCDLLLPTIIKLKVTPLIICTVAAQKIKLKNVSLCLLIVVLSKYFSRKHSGATDHQTAPGPYIY